MASAEGTLSPRDRGDQGDHEGQGQTDPVPVQDKCHGGDTEVFCGRIPKDMTEVEIKDLFMTFGPIKDVRLPKFEVTGSHKGFAFINFEQQEDALKAISKLNGRQVRRRQYLKVTRSLPNSRLFVGNIPKAKGRDELFREFAAKAGGLKEVIVYKSPDSVDKKNRGFCFLEYDTHKAAATAKRNFCTRDTKIFGCDILCDWADPEQDVDDATMSKVQILYVRNISAAVSEEELRGLFSSFGPLDRVKKIKDFAFIHFATREDACRAKDELNGHQLHGVGIELQWAKPPITKEMRQATLRAREKRIYMQNYYKAPPVPAVNPFPPVNWYDDTYYRRDRGDHQVEHAPIVHHVPQAPIVSRPAPAAWITQTASAPWITQTASAPWLNPYHAIPTSVAWTYPTFVATSQAAPAPRPVPLPVPEVPEVPSVPPSTIEPAARALTPVSIDDLDYDGPGHPMFGIRLPRIPSFVFEVSSEEEDQSMGTTYTEDGYTRGRKKFGNFNSGEADEVENWRAAAAANNNNSSSSPIAEGNTSQPHPSRRSEAEQVENWRVRK